MKYFFTALTFGVTGDDRTSGRDDTRSELRILMGLHYTVGTLEEKLYLDQQGKIRKKYIEIGGVLLQEIIQKFS